MGGTIVCGVKESLDRPSAVELASALAERLGLRLVLVHVVDGVPPGTETTASARRRRSGAEQILEAVAREIGTPMETRVVLGNPPEGLAQAAAEEGADLIILGARSTGIGGRRLRCTLAGELEAATTVPVVVASPSTLKRSHHRLSLASEAGTR
jgi:nucleotide-binding universal stress UspA family protein